MGRELDEPLSCCTSQDCWEDLTHEEVDGPIKHHLRSEYCYMPQRVRLFIIYI